MSKLYGMKNSDGSFSFYKGDLVYQDKNHGWRNISESYYVHDTNKDMVEFIKTRFYDMGKISIKPKNKYSIKIPKDSVIKFFEEIKNSKDQVIDVSSLEELLSY